MSYLKPKIKYENFKPSKDQRELISFKVNKLSLEAPSDSTVRLFVKKMSNDYKGVIKICSEVGVFTSENIASSPENLIVNIEREIREKLNLWKKNRFSKIAEAM